MGHKVDVYRRLTSSTVREASQTVPSCVDFSSWGKNKDLEDKISSLECVYVDTNTFCFYVFCLMCLLSHLSTEVLFVSVQECVSVRVAQRGWGKATLVAPNCNAGLAGWFMGPLSHLNHKRCQPCRTCAHWPKCFWLTQATVFLRTHKKVEGECCIQIRSALLC